MQNVGLSRSSSVVRPPAEKPMTVFNFPQLKLSGEHHPEADCGAGSVIKEEACLAGETSNPQNNFLPIASMDGYYQRSDNNKMESGNQ